MPQAWRDKIRVAQLLNHLEKNALGTLVDPNTKKAYRLDGGQVKSAEILLKKVLPDLTENKTELSGGLTINVNKP